jgi:hypothetical protein
MWADNNCLHSLAAPIRYLHMRMWVTFRGEPLRIGVKMQADNKRLHPLSASIRYLHMRMQMRLIITSAFHIYIYIG